MVSTSPFLISEYLQGDGLNKVFSFHFNAILKPNQRHYVCVSVIDANGVAYSKDEGSDYVVKATQNGGTVEFLTFVPAVTDHVRIFGCVTINFDTQYPPSSPILGKNLDDELTKVYVILAQLMQCCTNSVHTTFDATTGVYYEYNVGNLNPDELLALDHLGKTIVSAGFTRKEVEDKLTQIIAMQKLVDAAQQNVLAAEQNMQNFYNGLVTQWNAAQRDIADFNAKYPALKKILDQIPDISAAPDGVGLVTSNHQYILKPVVTPDVLKDGEVLGREGQNFASRRVLEVEGNFSQGQALAITRTVGERVVAVGVAFPSGGGSGGGSSGGNIDFVGDPNGTGIVANNGLVDKRPVLNVQPADLPSGMRVHEKIEFASGMQPGIAYNLIAVNDPLTKEVVFMVGNSVAAGGTGTGAGTGQVAPGPIRDGQILVGQSGIPTPTDNPLVDFFPGGTLQDGATPVFSATAGKFLPQVITGVNDAVKAMFHSPVVLGTPAIAGADAGSNVHRVTVSKLTVAYPDGDSMAAYTIAAPLTIDVPSNAAATTFVYFDPATKALGTDTTGLNKNVVYLAIVVSDGAGESHTLPYYTDATGLASQFALQARELGKKAYDVNIVGKFGGELAQEGDRAYATGYNIGPVTSPDRFVLPIPINTAIRFEVVDSKMNTLAQNAKFLDALYIENTQAGTTGKVTANRIAIFAIYYTSIGYYLVAAQNTDFADMSSAETALLSHQYTMKLPVPLEYSGIFLGYCIAKSGVTDFNTDGSFRFLPDILKLGIATGGTGTAVPTPTAQDAGKILTADNSGALTWQANADISGLSNVANDQYVKRDAQGHIAGGTSAQIAHNAHGFWGYAVLTFQMTYSNENAMQSTTATGVAVGAAAAGNTVVFTRSQGTAFDVTVTLAANPDFAYVDNRAIYNNAYFCFYAGNTVKATKNGLVFTASIDLSNPFKLFFVYLSEI